MSTGISSAAMHMEIEDRMVYTHSVISSLTHCPSLADSPGSWGALMAEHTRCGMSASHWEGVPAGAAMQAGAIL